MKKIVLVLLIVLSLSLCSCETDMQGNTNALEDLTNSFDRTATITEKVLFDDKQIKITSKSITFSDSEMTLNIEIENNTANALNFSCGSSSCDVNSINKTMAADGFLNCEVAAGESASEIISFSIHEMLAYGISSVSYIDIGFWVSGDSYDNFYTGPLSLETSLSANDNQSTNDYQKFIKDGTMEKAFGTTIKYFSDQELYRNEDGTIRVTSVALIENKDGDIKALLEIENTSSEKVQAWGKEIHVNGELVKSNSAWIESINAGNKLIATFPISDYIKDYEGAENLTTLKEFAFTLSVGENSNIAKSSGKVTISVLDTDMSIAK